MNGQDDSPHQLGRSLRSFLEGVLGQRDSREVALSNSNQPVILMGNVPIFVRNQDRALDFYHDKLGLELLYDHTMAGIRWIALAPFRGATEISLLSPANDPPGNLLPEFDRNGQWSAITFLTDNIYRTYREWSDRGVPFDSGPALQSWGGVVARFHDPEGNHHHLVQPYNYNM